MPYKQNEAIWEGKRKPERGIISSSTVKARVLSVAAQTHLILIQFTNIYPSLILYFEERVEGSAVETLSKASDHKYNNISQMPGLHQNVDFALTVHYNSNSVLIIPEKLHLYSHHHIWVEYFIS